MKQGLGILVVSIVALAGLNGTIDLNELFNYEDQDFPLYVNRDNTPPDNRINDAMATLGRVLFYDTNLSANNQVACASCHKQAFAFGDNLPQSLGLNNGLTGRHSMRLVNARFADEGRFFWDERAVSLEDQTTRPIQDHVEMGFSGADGDPSLDSLFQKLSNIPYYQELFSFAYGDSNITELKMQRALAQFIRSIQSFDAKYDIGRAQVNNNNQPFPNFTAQENLGKMLFAQAPDQGGAGCATCHRPPTFDIDPNSSNNGVIGVAGSPGDIDLTNTRAPSLRDLINPLGLTNGPFMHDGSLLTLMDVVNHYDNINFNPAINPSLDPRLRGGQVGGGPGQGQNLGLSQAEKNALVAFLGTLSGSEIYTAEKWSNPFDENGELSIIPVCGTPAHVILEATICSGDLFEGYSETGIYTDVFSAANGCDSIRELQLIVLPDNHPDCVVNGTNEAIVDGTASAYPNPFRNALTIEFSSSAVETITLYDLRGRPLITEEASYNDNLIHLDTYQLPAGLYLVIGHNLSGERIFTTKVLKE